MTTLQLAVAAARYHSRMAVRESKYFHWDSGAKAQRELRDHWMRIAREQQ